MSVQLLGEKMKELETALFVSETRSLSSLPTHIIQIAEVDAEGNAWFIIPRPTQIPESFDKKMPARLEFFKKGKGFYLKLKGVASLIYSEDLLPKTKVFRELSESFKRKKLVAVKLKMESAKYFENAPKTNSNPMLNLGSRMYNWLITPLFGDDHRKQWATIPVYADHN